MYHLPRNPVLTSSDTVVVPSSSTAPTRSSNTVPTSTLPSLDELPDAEFLLSSPQNGSRKRESSGNGVVPSQQKFPRGGTQSSVAPVRNIRAPSAGTLVPPQLTGRLIQFVLGYGLICSGNSNDFMWNLVPFFLYHLFTNK